MYRSIEQDDEEDTKEKLVAIFATRSWTHIAAISAVWGEICDKYTLNGAIEKAFGSDSHSGTAMRTIAEFASQPYDYWARRLHEAMDGMGTDDETLRRIIISRAEVDLRDVGIVFGQRFGDGGT